MAKRREHKVKPFHQRSARWRKRCYINIKNSMRTDGNDGLFYTPHMFSDDNCEMDFWFIGKDKTPISVTIRNTRAAYIHAVWKAAGEALHKLVSTRELVGSSKGENWFEDMMERMRQPREILGGLNTHDWTMQEQSRLAQSGTIEVFEKSVVRPTSGGYDVDVTVDVPLITHEIVVEYIAKHQNRLPVASRGTKAFCYGFDATTFEQCGNVIPNVGT